MELTFVFPLTFHALNPSAVKVSKRANSTPAQKEEQGSKRMNKNNRGAR
jgi:hypothetical protein